MVSIDEKPLYEFAQFDVKEIYSSIKESPWKYKHQIKYTLSDMLYDTKDWRQSYCKKPLHCNVPFVKHTLIWFIICFSEVEHSLLTLFWEENN